MLSDDLQYLLILSKKGNLKRNEAIDFLLKKREPINFILPIDIMFYIVQKILENSNTIVAKKSSIEKRNIIQAFCGKSIYNELKEYIYPISLYKQIKICENISNMLIYNSRKYVSLTSYTIILINKNKKYNLHIDKDTKFEYYIKKMIDNITFVPKKATFHNDVLSTRTSFHVNKFVIKNFRRPIVFVGYTAKKSGW